MTSEILKHASKILREEYPRPLIGHTVDVYKNCSPIERQILFQTQNIYPPRLLKQNPR
jgi:hypothetical protein